MISVKDYQLNAKLNIVYSYMFNSQVDLAIFFYKCKQHCNINIVAFSFEC